MEKKLKINTEGLGFEAYLDDASCIFGEKIEKDTEPNNLNVSISESSVQHKVLSYTTDIETLELIFQKKTLRSSSLSNANLNDPMEKERVGVSKFAGSRFITCFCQSDYECVPFWLNYGKNIRKNKVLMQFRNFAKCFEDCIYTDYAMVSGDKKCYFQSPEYGKAINNQWNPNVSTDDYDLRVCVDFISIFDVEYVPINSEVFTEDNAGEVSIDFGKITGQENAKAVMKGYNTTVLGKQKSKPWDYEKETRILSTLSNPYFKEWNYIDLRLKSEMFRDLTIVLSPWDDNTSKEKIETIVENSGLPSDIIDSIRIMDSSLKGKLNFPECD